MNIKMLNPDCEESKRLVEWVEKGMLDAHLSIDDLYSPTIRLGWTVDFISSLDPLRRGEQLLCNRSGGS